MIRSPSTQMAQSPEAPELPFPDWFDGLLGTVPPAEGEAVEVGGQVLVCRDGILRSEALLSSDQQQTSDAFAFKWHKRDSFEDGVSRQMREWLVRRYGDMASAAWLAEHGDQPILLDAGCGGGMSGLELFGPVMSGLRYVGVDVSEAVEVARDRISERGFDGAFLQSDFLQLPFAEKTVDLVFAEGVMHHSHSTEAALKALARLLKPGGRFLFYIYRKKGPIREFTDDYVREKLKDLTPQEAWQAVEPLTRLGEALGRLQIEVDVPEEVALFDIPKGRMDLQRLFYWHVFKAFYNPDLSFDEMNHINYDWYAPRYAHRQTEEEARRWCDEASLEIEREVVEEAGITMIARKLD